MDKYNNKTCVSIEKDSNGNLTGRELHGKEREEFIQHLDSKIEYRIKPLDFVRPIPGIEKIGTIFKNGKLNNVYKEYDNSKCVGIVKESTGSRCSVIWIGNDPIKCAWWDVSELEIIDNLPNLLSRTMCHPSAANQDVANDVFPINKESNITQEAANNLKEICKAVEKQGKQINNSNEQN